MKVATEILKQLGGNQFIAMTNAKNIAAFENGVQFGIGAGAKKGINKVRITLTDFDTYVVEFFKINARKCTVDVIAKIDPVYCDNIRQIFTAETGFYTTL